MSDIELACHLSPWGNHGFINALADIEHAGYRGVEATSEIVELYEDRVGVFTEILVQHRLNLIAISAGGSLWPGMNLDEEVERNLNIARFLKSSGAKYLTLAPPRPNPEKPLEDELDLMPAATAYGEIARRTLELDIQTCLHPEIGSFVDDAKRLNKFLQMADPEALRICVDAGFLHEAGLSASDFIKEHQKRLGLIHLRNVKPSDGKSKKKTKRGRAPHRMTSVTLGEGNVDLHSFVKAIMASDYVGWATVVFDEGAGPLVKTARACHRFVEQELDLVL